MGLLERRREREAERAAAKAAQAEQARVAAEQQRQQTATWCLTVARAIAAGTATARDAPISPKKGERVLYAIAGAGLVEPRRGPGHWQGGSQSVSVHIPGTKSMRYRVGGSRGTYAPGEEKPTIIDTGTFAITDHRAVFIGSKQTREWSWSKLIGFHDDDSVNWVGIAVSNRQKLSGVSYDRDHALPIRWYLECAAAKANEHLAELIANLEAEARAPSPPPTVPGSP